MKPLACYTVLVVGLLSAACREGGMRAVLDFGAWPSEGVFTKDSQGNYQRENTELPPMTLVELSRYIRQWRAENGG
jgi:hypothetical protein